MLRSFQTIRDVGIIVAAGAPSAEGVGELCTFGPLAERKRQWLLVFEDRDRSDMHFDCEDEALKYFNRASLSWNCTLFVTAANA